MVSDICSSKSNGKRKSLFQFVVDTSTENIYFGGWPCRKRRSYIGNGEKAPLSLRTTYFLLLVFSRKTFIFGIDSMRRPIDLPEARSGVVLNCIFLLKNGTCTVVLPKRAPRLHLTYMIHRAMYVNICADQLTYRKFVCQYFHCKRLSQRNGGRTAPARRCVARNAIAWTPRCGRRLRWPAAPRSEHSSCATIYMIRRRWLCESGMTEGVEVLSSVKPRSCAMF